MSSSVFKRICSIICLSASILQAFLISSTKSIHNINRHCNSSSRSKSALMEMAKKQELTESSNSDNIGMKSIGLDAKDPSENFDEDAANLDSWLVRIEKSIARSRKIKGGNYVQLATVDPATGFPTCRTVVFRGFLTLPNDRGIVMKMITDNRSEKVKHVTGSEANAHGCPCEMVWWFSQSSEQYRIAGKLILVGPSSSSSKVEVFGGGNDWKGENVESLIPFLENARKQMWGNLSVPAKEQFYWPPPGQLFTESIGEEPPKSSLELPETFLMMLLAPTSVKYLRLKDNFAQNDHLITSDVFEGVSTRWKSERVNP